MCGSSVIAAGTAAGAPPDVGAAADEFGDHPSHKGDDGTLKMSISDYNTNGDINVGGTNEGGVTSLVAVTINYLAISVVAGSSLLLILRLLWSRRRRNQRRMGDGRVGDGSGCDAGVEGTTFGALAADTGGQPPGEYGNRHSSEQGDGDGFSETSYDLDPMWDPDDCNTSTRSDQGERIYNNHDELDEQFAMPAATPMREGWERFYSPLGERPDLVVNVLFYDKDIRSIVGVLV